MDRELLMREFAGLNKQTREMEDNQRGYAIRHEDLQLKVFKAVDELRDRPAAFLKADPEGKADILKQMAERVIISENGIRIDWKKPYVYLMRPILRRLEGGQGADGADIKKDALVSSKRPLLWAEKDEVRTEIEKIALNLRLWFGREMASG